MWQFVAYSLYLYWICQNLPVPTIHSIAHGAFTVAINQNSQICFHPWDEACTSVRLTAYIFWQHLFQGGNLQPQAPLKHGADSTLKCSEEPRVEIDEPLSISVLVSGVKCAISQYKTEPQSIISMLWHLCI